MPGVTKHIFNHEICDILSMFNCQIKTIEPLLPKEYSSGDIIALLKNSIRMSGILLKSSMFIIKPKTVILKENSEKQIQHESTGGANGRLSVQENSVKGISAHTL